jgi:ribosomal protein L11 methyltransferase
VPYRIDIACPPADALDQLIELGALDIEAVGDGVAAILPDAITHDRLMQALGTDAITVSAAVARDRGSVWLLRPRPVRIGGVPIAPPDAPAAPDTLRLIDSQAFGTGHHPTTALCMEALEEILTVDPCDRLLDVGTGTGILALTALRLGVSHAVGVDIDADALRVAAENARLNHWAERLQLVLGGPGTVEGTWPLVVANVLAAPLIEMAPTLVRRVAHRGRLILSGISSSLAPEVRAAYEHLGMRQIGSRDRAGWTVLINQASW